MTMEEKWDKVWGNEIWKTKMRKYINENMLGCQKMSFGFFYTILWKNSSDIFGQPSILEWQEMWAEEPRGRMAGHKAGVRPIWEPAQAHGQIGHWWNTEVYKQQRVHTCHVKARVGVQGPRAEISEPESCARCQTSWSQVREAAVRDTAEPPEHSA